jgi:superfamily II DNA or RNA helicase
MAKQKKISRLRKPEGMSLEQWQIALRRQFATAQEFQLQNIGTQPIFSEFSVGNPKTGTQYRVAIRGSQPGENYCSCPDFAINTLGTCKHIEYTLFRLKNRPGGEKAMAAGFNQPYSEVFLCYGVKREVMFKAGSECPQTLKNLAKQYFDSRGVLREDAYARFHTFIRLAGGFSHDLRCYDDALEFIAHKRDKDNLPRVVHKAFPQGIHSAALAKLLQVSLYPYQIKGALFAAQAGRCLIADDMGLGKTIEAIAAVEILAKAVGVERVLIVSPTSLKHQWKQEIARFSTRNATVVEGGSARRLFLYSADKSFYKITNYDVIHRDMQAIQSWSPDLIILDEAQRIKNWQTRTAQTVKKLESKYAMVLTGTPLENRLEELHSIVEFVDRHHLGPRFRFLAEHQHVEENGRVIGYRNLAGIGRTLEPILIRRTRQEVLKELPERLDKNYFLPMTDPQRKLHEENREIVARIVAKWRRWGFLSDTDQRILRSALQNMRMSCDSTYLLDKETDHGVKADELIVVLGEMFEQPQTKAVVFSQWLRMHELISQRLESHRYGYTFFHGAVPSPKRKDLVRRFKEDPQCRVFLSTDAGGLGLNLQNASVVVNVDLPWNPAVLEQRIGRVHRLGQHRPVRVVNFIAQGTIEHGILSLLSFKKALFAGVLEQGQDEVFLGGTRLKRFMDSVEKTTGSIPQSMPATETEAEQAELQRKEAAKGKAAEQAPAAAPSGWEQLLSAGLSLLGNLAQTAGTRQADTGRIAETFAGIKIEQDKTDGRPQLKIPLPPKETLVMIANILQEFATRL